MENIDSINNPNDNFYVHVTSAMTSFGEYLLDPLMMVLKKKAEVDSKQEPK